MRTKKDHPIATLTIHGMDTMTPKQINNLTDWLYKKYDELDSASTEFIRKNYSKRFTARLYK